MRNLLLALVVCLIGFACQSGSHLERSISGHAEDLWGGPIDLGEWHDQTIILHPINTAT
jgi:hypothetical protein